MVEKWLQQVEEVMLASMRQVIENGIEAYAQVTGIRVHVPGHWGCKANFEELFGWISLPGPLVCY